MRHGADTRAMGLTGAAICAVAAVLNIVEAVVPGGAPVSPGPGFGAVAMTLVLLVGGYRLPSRVLFLFGPVGAALVAAAVATTDTYSDAAVLYMWPAVWTAYFFGRAGTAFVVAFIAGAHGVALAALPPGVGSTDRWIDTVVAVTVVAGTVHWLAGRNRRLLARLEAEARVDALTGLENRRGFEERLHAEVARAAREGRPLAAVCFDVDHFKDVNDAFGHAMGDRVLRHVGRVLHAEARGVDVAARTGGEEFTVLLPGAGAAAAEAFAERVRDRLLSVSDAVAAEHGTAPPRLTVSAGVAVAATAEDAAGLVARADAALYAAKAAGRDRVVVAAPA